MALLGRYEYVEELGRGSRGRVVACVDLQADGRPVALKRVRTEHVAGLLWEVERLSQLAAPQLARVHALHVLEEAEPAPFAFPRGSAVLVQDRAEGVDALSAGRGRRVAAGALASFIYALARDALLALRELHAAGFVHRDVKPDNLVVDAAGRATLVDLELAMPPGPVRELSGSTAYLPPEAWAGQLTPSADVYALGATLVDVWMGEAPVEGQTGRGASAGPWLERDLSALPASVPEPVRGLLRAWLDPHPELRPADAAAALVQLEGCARDFGVEAEPALLRWATGQGPAADVAARAGRLPWMGPRGPVEELLALLRQGGLVQVAGPTGAGGSRLVREAVLGLQIERARSAETAPEYVRARDADAAIRATGGQVVHLERPEPDLLDAARGACETALLAGRYACVVVEGHAPLDGVPSVALKGLPRKAVADLLKVALGEPPGSGLLEAVAAATDGLAGRICNRLAAVDAGDPRDPASWRPGGYEGGWLTGLPGRLADWLSALALWDAAVDAETLGGSGLTPREVAQLARHVARRDGWLPQATRIALRAEVARELRAGLTAQARAAATEALRRALGELPRGSPWVWEGAQLRAAALERAAGLRASGDVTGAVALLEEATGRCAHEALRHAWADGLRAQGRYAAALAALGKPREATSRLLRAELLRLSGDRSGARAALKALAAGEGPPAGHACALLSRMAMDEGDRDASQRWLAQGRPLVGEDGPARLAACEAAVRAAQPDDAVAAADDYWAVAVRFASPRHQARAASLRASLRAVGDGRAAADWLSAHHTALRLGEVHEAASYAFNLGLSRLDAGDLAGALEMLREGAQGFARLQRPAELGRVLFNWANAWVLMGEHVLAERVLERAEAESGRVNDAPSLTLCAVLRAELAVREGALQRAESALQGALGSAPEALAPLVAARLAFMWASRERLDEASAVLSPYAHLQGPAHAELELARVRLALARGGSEDAGVHIGGLLAALEREGTFELRIRALLLGAEVARSLGDAAGATARLSRCRVLLDAAMRGLSPAQQSRLRSVEHYARAFDTMPAQQARGEAEPASAAGRLLESVPRLFRAASRQAAADVLCEVALELVPAERALLLVREADATRVRGAAGAQREGEGRYSESIAVQALTGGQTVSAMDAVTDARFDGSASVRALALRSVVAVPLRAAGEHAVLYVDDSLRPAAFGPADVECIRALARAGEAALWVAGQREADRQARRAAEARAEALSAELQHGAAVDGDIVGTSEALRACLSLADRVAGSDLPVLVQGESGSGKELIARRVHRRSRRANEAFVAENCAALPEALLESALFGHVRGAFTGASRDHRGLFEQADGGTLFLDEVGEMSPGMQAKLLRVLESGEVRPVGGQRERVVDVRVIAATHRDLARDVEQGRFREDLFYRLAVVQIAVPPLRERREDIAALVQHFVAVHGGGRELRVDPRAMHALQQRELRGNVRELENLVRRAIVLADDVIELEHVRQPSREPEVDALDLHAQVQALQRRLVGEALSRAEGNQTRAAELLGVSRYGLQKMLKRLGAS